METEIRMPRASETMETGRVASWLVADGSTVRRGDPIAEIETDKTTLVLEARASGVLAITAPAGTELPVNAPLGSIASV